MTSIPADAIVSARPSVLAATGSAVDAIGLILTTSIRSPIGSVLPFANANDVGTYFGLSSDEFKAAAIYFAGFTGSSVRPASLLFAQYNTANVAAYLRGKRVSGLTITQLQALTGTLAIVTQAGSLTSSSIDLSGAGSFSAAATTIQAAFTTPSFSVSYDATQGAFVFTTTATGGSATMAFATGSGSILTGLGLTAVTGAVLSQGAAAATPAAFMTTLTGVTRDWASFMTLFNPDNSGNANKLAFATWNGLQNDQYIYVAWDTDVTATNTVPASSSLGQLLITEDIDGTYPIYSPDYTLAAFACAVGASVDFDEAEGRTTYAFRRQSGLLPSVTDQTTAANLIANGYNFYGAYTTRAAPYVWMYPGLISGAFDWADSYLNQIWLISDLQDSCMVLLRDRKSIPFNPAGDQLVAAACLDPINKAVNFGAIRPNVTLTDLQIEEVNADAGKKIDNILSTLGWYLLVVPSAPDVRAKRGPKQVKLWYMDGQSVQSITLDTIELQ